jgi:hypothetical protein
MIDNIIDDSLLWGSWDSFVVAVGLAVSLAPFSVAGSLALIALGLLIYYKYLRKEEIPSTAEMVSNGYLSENEINYFISKTVTDNRKQVENDLQLKRLEQDLYELRKLVLS